jgi:hypothetical protein
MKVFCRKLRAKARRATISAIFEKNLSDRLFDGLNGERFVSAYKVQQLHLPDQGRRSLHSKTQ